MSLLQTHGFSVYSASPVPFRCWKSTVYSVKNWESGKVLLDVIRNGIVSF